MKEEIIDMSVCITDSYTQANCVIADGRLCAIQESLLKIAEAIDQLDNRMHSKNDLTAQVSEIIKDIEIIH